MTIANSKDQEKERDIDELDREVLALLDGKQATKASRQEQSLAPSLLQKLSATSSGDTRLQKVTRVEVIDSNGRIYTNYNCKDVEIQLQDDNRTLKIFLK